MSPQASIATPTPGTDPPDASTANPDTARSSIPTQGPAGNEALGASLPGLEKREQAVSKAMPPPPLEHPTVTPTQTQASDARTSTASPSKSQNTAISPAAASGKDGVESSSREKERERPDFTPFFTLVNDVSFAGAGAEGKDEKSTHHPARVHYIFEDDEDSEVLTAALVRSMETHVPPTTRPEEAVELERSRPREATREERVIIVDVNAAGDAVTKVVSLSPSWAVLSAEIGKAPTWDGGDEGEGGNAAVGGLMLRIEGTGIGHTEHGGGLGGSSSGSKGKGKEVEREGGAGSGEGLGLGLGLGSGVERGGIGDEEMQALLEGFDRKMGVLRRIVRLGSRESLGGAEGEV